MAAMGFCIVSSSTGGGGGSLCALSRGRAPSGARGMVTGFDCVRYMFGEADVAILRLAAVVLLAGGNADLQALVALLEAQLGTPW